jgi:voltage-gated potassium channel
MNTPLRRIIRGAISLFVVFLLSILGFHFIAGHDWLQSIWMVVVTISTVGYGEGTQTGAATQIFTILVILLEGISKPKIVRSS